MDLIILKGVNVSDILSLGLLSYIQTELSEPRTTAHEPKVFPDRPEETVVMPTVSEAEETPAEAKKRGRPPKKDLDAKPPEQALVANKPIDIDSLRDLCKAAIRKGIKHDRLLEVFAEFVPGATLLSQIHPDQWTSLAERLLEVTNASD